MFLYVRMFSQPMTTRTSTKPREPAVFTLLDINELYVQARVQQIIQSAIPNFVFQPARGTENPFDTRRACRKASNATPPALTRASLR